MRSRRAGSRRRACAAGSRGGSCGRRPASKTTRRCSTGSHASPSGLAGGRSRSRRTTRLRSSSRRIPRRPRPKLDARERNRAVGVVVAVGVEDPVLGLALRNVFLQHHVRLGRPPRRKLEQVGSALDKGAARNHRRGQSQPRLDVLGDDRERPERCELADVVERLREERVRCCDPDGLTQLVEPSLAGELPRQVRRDTGPEKVGGGLGILREEDRSLVVRRDRDRPPAKPLGDACEPVEQRRVVFEAGRRPHEPPREPAAQARRREPALRDRIDGHSRPSEASDRADGSVMERVAPDPDQQDGTLPSSSTTEVTSPGRFRSSTERSPGRCPLEQPRLLSLPRWRPRPGFLPSSAR